MEAITIIIVVALLIEAVVETIKMTIEGGIKWQNIAAAVLGILLAYFCHIGIMAALGIDVPILVDVLITGILLSRGSNFISDLFDKIKGGTIQLALEPVEESE